MQFNQNDENMLNRLSGKKLDSDKYRQQLKESLNQTQEHNILKCYEFFDRRIAIITQYKYKSTFFGICIYKV